MGVKQIDSEPTFKDSIIKFFKTSFTKKRLIIKTIIFIVCCIIIIVPSAILDSWAQHSPKSHYEGLMPWFIRIQIQYNDGVAFSSGSGSSPAFIYTIQWLSSILILFLAFSFNNYILVIPLMCAAVGGFENVIARAIPKTFHGDITNGIYQHVVTDYFEFAFWPGFAVFNLPDSFVVVGFITFIISYIVLLFIPKNKKIWGIIGETKNGDKISKNHKEEIRNENSTIEKLE